VRVLPVPTKPNAQFALRLYYSHAGRSVRPVRGESSGDGSFVTAECSAYNQCTYEAEFLLGLRLARCSFTARANSSRRTLISQSLQMANKLDSASAHAEASHLNGAADAARYRVDGKTFDVAEKHGGAFVDPG
jgi:hypothetical protein